MLNEEKVLQEKLPDFFCHDSCFSFFSLKLIIGVITIFDKYLFIALSWRHKVDV